MKKFISIILLISLVLSLGSNMALANNMIDDSKIQERQNVKEDLLNKYQDYITNLYMSDLKLTNIGINMGISQIQEKTVEELKKAGYKTYSVSSTTYDSVEKELSTDLEEMGIEKGGSYIVVVEGEESDSLIQPTMETKGAVIPPDAGFEYVYNGTTYIMRYVTVTAAENSYMKKLTRVNLLKNPTEDMLINMLNTIISVGFSAVYPELGTVAEICGLSIADFKPDPDSYFELVCRTNWTRIFTQVLDADGWHNGSYVTNAKAKVNFEGTYYSPKLNEYVDVDEKQVSKTFYSEHYSNLTWRKQHAAKGYTSVMVWPDNVGDIKYRYGNVVKATHSENFL